MMNYELIVNYISRQPNYPLSIINYQLFCASVAFVLLSLSRQQNLHGVDYNLHKGQVKKFSLINVASLRFL
jgi:hypothetical protein